METERGCNWESGPLSAKVGLAAFELVAGEGAERRARDYGESDEAQEQQPRECSEQPGLELCVEGVVGAEAAACYACEHHEQRDDERREHQELEQLLVRSDPKALRTP